MEPLVGDAEVMRDLMDHGVPDGLDDVIEIAAARSDRQPVDRDAVGQEAGIAAGPLGQRHAVVEPEQVGRRTHVLDNDGNIAHEPAELGRDRVECGLDQPPERVLVDIDHTSIMTPPDE